MENYFNKRVSYRGMGSYGPQSQCYVRIWEKDGQNIVLFQDLGIGTSVTNASEHIANTVKPFLTHPENVRFFETYRDDLTEVDEVSYSKTDPYDQPTWRRCQDFLNLINT